MAMKSLVLRLQEIIQELRSFALASPFEQTWQASFLNGVANILEAWLEGRDW